MSIIRITDSFKPGYPRVPLSDVGKTAPPIGTGKVGSAVLNQAQADILNMKSVAGPGVLPSYRYWRTVFIGDASGGLVVWNEVEFWSGPNGTGTKFTTPSTPVTTNGTLQDPGLPGSILVDGDTAESQSWLGYAALMNPLAGKYWQFDLGAPRDVKSVLLYTYLGSYHVLQVHIDASVDGVAWDRVVTNQSISQVTRPTVAAIG